MATSSAGFPSSSDYKDYGQVKESAHGYENDFSYGTTVATSMELVRLGFIRKVYGILTAQLLLTTLVSALCMLVPAVRGFILAAPWLVVLSVFGTFGTLIALMFMKDKHPENLYVLGAFTFFESIAIGNVCAIYEEAGAGYIVLEAFLLTMLIFGSLTAYCFISKKDFSFLGGFLVAVLMAVIGASFINLILGFTGHYSMWFAFGISCVSVVLFSAMILYDTSLLIHKLSPDEYILASISLYLDILNLFLHMLRILSQLQDRN